MSGIATQPDIPADHLDSEQYRTAAAYDWVYEHRGRVELTGAGAWHVGMERRGGLLPG